MIVKNRPLEQWQIDHILRVQQELGSPDTEEDEMNGDMTGENLQGALPQAGDAVDAAGALAVYKDPDVLKAQTEYETLAKKQTDRYDALERAIAEKRYAPSFSERMFQLSAALAAPTTRRGFGGVLENITPVLAAQEKARREGEISRREALEKLDADRLAQQVGLAKQGFSTSIALARLAKQGVGTGRTYDAPRGVWVDRNNPRPTENSYTDPTTKRTFVKWQDGYWREKQPNGGYKVFEREGEDWVEIGIEGAR